jgi:phenylalanyl-tRNA synthetase alpha chain
MSTEELAKTLHPLERKVLPQLKKEILFDELTEKSGLKDVESMRAVQWMENKGIVKIKAEEKDIIDLDKNGLRYKKEGLPEKRLLGLIKEKELALGELKKKIDPGEINIAIGVLRKTGAISIRKENDLLISITPEGKKLLGRESPEEKFLKKTFPLEYGSLSKEDKSVLDELLKRREIVKKDRRTLRIISLTPLGEKLQKMKISADVIDRLTSKDLKAKAWKDKDFRRFDVEINVPQISGGRRHFTNHALEYIKSIWLELGFKEMTGSMVQTSFWDLDALFVPQDHPAREMQDTFYIKSPSKGKLPDKELVTRVKKTHENGWTTGSKGWRTEWSEEIAKENLLRTHTTVLSARTIAKLKKEELPAKFFSVGKCFRNETLDWKHLFEFYQVEGIVVDPDANFSNLLGYLKEFFRKMGFPDVRIRPSHFPYTEPSAQVEVFHPVKKEWVELGGSGVFRPEVLKPLLGIEVPVLAWGLGLDRLIKEYWDMTDIRDAYKNDIRQLRELKLWLK